MHHQLRLTILLVVAFVLGVSSAAQADKMFFNGVHGLQFSNLGQIDTTASGTGIAIINGSAGIGHLNTLQLTKPFVTLNPIIPVTDPIVTAGGIVEIRITSMRINPAPVGAGGAFKPISGAAANTQLGLTLSTMPLAGQVRICLFVAGCTAGSLDSNLGVSTANGALTGQGVGGLLTIGGSGGIRISILGAPWTLKNVSISNRTNNGAITLFGQNGFVHGPASLTSSTAVTSGVVQLVTANQTTVVGVPGNSDLNGQINRLVLHFTPEPGVLLLLGAGAAGLVVLGRSRIRK